MAAARSTVGGTPAPRKRDGKENVHVFVRARPLDERKDEQRGPFRFEGKEVSYRGGGQQARRGEHKYEFEEVFRTNSTQEEVFLRACKPLVDNVVAGYSCTLFAYGQTNSGKTHTMMGADGNPTDDQRGVIPRAAKYLFERLVADPGRATVRISCAELYNEGFYDMLSEEQELQALRLLNDEKGRCVVRGITEHVVSDADDVMGKLCHAAQRRHTAATGMNDRSSRSHFIATLSVTTQVEEEVRAAAGAEAKQESFRVGKIHLVDLAGSESAKRAENSANTRDRSKQIQREGASINKSLLTLGKVIMKLTEPAPGFIPYRESQLTRFLQDSLGGRAITHIIATISLSVTNIDETLSTLDYASTAKKIENEPMVNRQVCGQQLMGEIQEQLAHLRNQLAAQRASDGVIKITQEEWDKMRLTLHDLREGGAASQERIGELEQEVSALQEKCSDLAVANLRKNKLLLRHQGTEDNLAGVITTQVGRQAAFEGVIAVRDGLAARNKAKLDQFVDHGRTLARDAAQGADRTAANTQEAFRIVASRATDTARTTAGFAQAASAEAAAALAQHHEAMKAVGSTAAAGATGLAEELRAAQGAAREAAAKGGAMGEAHRAAGLRDLAAMTEAAAAALQRVSEAARAHQGGADALLADHCIATVSKVAASALQGADSVIAAAAAAKSAEDAARAHYFGAAAGASSQQGKEFAEAHSAAADRQRQADQTLEQETAEQCAAMQRAAADELTQLEARRAELRRQLGDVSSQQSAVQGQIAARDSALHFEQERVAAWQNHAVQLAIATGTAMRSQAQAEHGAAVTQLKGQLQGLSSQVAEIGDRLDELAPLIAAAQATAQQTAQGVRAACEKRCAESAALCQTLAAAVQQDSEQRAAAAAAAQSFDADSERRGSGATAQLQSAARDAAAAAERAASSATEALRAAAKELQGKHVTEIGDKLAQVGAACAAAQREGQEGAAARAQEREALAEWAAQGAVQRLEQVATKVEALPQRLSEAAAPGSTACTARSQSAQQKLQELSEASEQQPAAWAAHCSAAAAGIKQELTQARGLAESLESACDALGSQWERHEPGATPARVIPEITLTDYADSPAGQSSPVTKTPVPKAYPAMTPPRRQRPRAPSSAPPSPMLQGGRSGKPFGTLTPTGNATTPPRRSEKRARLHSPGHMEA